MARVRVVVRLGGHRLEGDGELVVIGNRFLVQLDVRCFSPATVRAYAFDLANFAGFLADRSLTLAAVAPTDLFGYLDWQSGQRAASADTRRIWADLTGPSSIEERREGGHIAFRRDPDQPAAVVVHDDGQVFVAAPDLIDKTRPITAPTPRHATRIKSTTADFEV